MKYYVLDTETVNDPENCRIWLWDIYDMQNFKHFRGTEIESLFDFFEKKSGTYYVHKLAFDGEFIINYLLNNNYEYVKQGKLHSYQFNCLITAANLFYFMVIKCDHTEIRLFDTLKIFNMSVEKIAQAYDLPIQKGKIDYNAYRPVGYIPTEKEIKYIENDTEIIAKAVEILRDNGMKKKTSAANAMAYFKKMIGANYFLKIFPIEEKTTIDFCRNAYKGGFAYVNPKFKNKNLKNGFVLDYNSAHAYSMYSPHKIPCGKGKYFTGKYTGNNLYFQRFAAIFTIKPKKLPCVSPAFFSRFGSLDWAESSCGSYMELTLCTPDMELFMENYDITDIIYIDGFEYDYTIGIFDQYVNHWYEEKFEASINGNLPKKEIAKMMLTNLYGKFAQSTDNTLREPIIKEKKIKIGDKEYIHPIIQYKNYKGKERKPIYLPVAAFTTAYTRTRLIRDCQKLYDFYSYSDTDSAHFVGISYDEVLKMGLLQIHDTDLGAFKLEYEFLKAKYLKPKLYREFRADTYTWENKVAGLTESAKSQITQKNFTYGTIYKHKKTQYHVKSGIVIGDTTYRISLDRSVKKYYNYGRD